MAFDKQGKLDVDQKVGIRDSSDPQHPPLSKSPSSPVNSETVGESLNTCSAPDTECDDGADAGLSLRKTFWERLKHRVGWHSSEWNFDIEVPQVDPPLDNHPNGYGKVAAFQDSDPSFLILRKFGWLHNCVLLDLQDELQVLEWRLENHNIIEKRVGNSSNLTTRRQDYQHPLSRSTIIGEIRDKLAQYDEILLRTQSIQAIRRPSKRHQNSLYNYIKEDRKINAEELNWIKMRNDLAAVSRNAEHGWPNSFIERHLRKLSEPLLLMLFRTEAQEEKSKNSEGLHLVSNYRINNVLRAIVTVVATTQLLVAVYILFRLAPTTPADVQRSGNFQILVIFFFTLLFSATCSVFTKAKPQEVFGATAAYCAVLVVFLGNSTSGMISNAASS